MVMQFIIKAKRNSRHIDHSMFVELCRATVKQVQCKPLSVPGKSRDDMSDPGRIPSTRSTNVDTKIQRLMRIPDSDCSTFLPKHQPSSTFADAIIPLKMGHKYARSIRAYGALHYAFQACVGYIAWPCAMRPHRAAEGGSHSLVKTGPAGRPIRVTITIDRVNPFWVQTRTPPLFRGGVIRQLTC